MFGESLQASVISKLHGEVELESREGREVCVRVRVCVYERVSKLGKVGAGGEPKGQWGKCSSNSVGCPGRGGFPGPAERAPAGSGQAGWRVWRKEIGSARLAGSRGVSSPQPALQPRPLAGLPAALAGSGALPRGRRGSALL